MNRTIFSAATAISIALAGSAHAALLSDDFENDTLGGLPDSPPWNGGTAVDSGSTLEVVADAADVFGLGVTNQAVRLDDDAGGSSNLLLGAAGLGGSDVVTLSFDYFETDDSSLANDFFVIRLGQNDGSGDANTIFDFQINEGNITADSTSGDESVSNAYSSGEAVRFTIVANNSTSSESYTGFGGTTTSVASATADIYIDGVLVFDDATSKNTVAAGNSFDTLRFLSFNFNQSPDVLIDNVLLVDGAVIPEPTSVAAVSLLGLCMLRRRQH